MKQALALACAVVLGLGASLLVLRSHVWPLDAVIEDGGDYGLFTWDLWIVNDSALGLRNPLHTDGVYYPVGAWLARHTLAAGFLPLTLAVDLATGADPLYPAYAYRVAIWISFALTLVLAYLVFRELGQPRLAAAVPAVQYAFCNYQQLHIPHLNHLAGAFVIAGSTLLLVRLVREPSRRRALWLAAWLAVAVYFGEFVVFFGLGLIGLLGCAVLTAPWRARLIDTLRAIGWRTAATALLLGLLIFAPFLHAWLADAGRAPKEKQSGNWSANAAGYFVPEQGFNPVYADTLALPGRDLKGIGGRETFLGYPVLLFALLALIVVRDPVPRAAALVFVFYFVLSLGPELKLLGLNTRLPLPYKLLMHVPPFDMARAPVRFALPGLFCLAIVAAYGLGWACGRVRSLTGRAGVAILGSVLLAWAGAEAYRPTPPAYRYAIPPQLSQLVPGPVINVPISFWDGYGVFLQTLHGHPMATGFVSRRTAAQLEHVRSLDRLLESDVPGFARRLQELGVTNVILAPQTPRVVRERFRGFPIHVVDMKAD
jgi:hypothetical protein